MAPAGDTRRTGLPISKAGRKEELRRRPGLPPPGPPPLKKRRPRVNGTRRNVRRRQAIEALGEPEGRLTGGGRGSSRVRRRGFWKGGWLGIWVISGDTRYILAQDLGTGGDTRYRLGTPGPRGSGGGGKALGAAAAFATVARNSHLAPPPAPARKLCCRNRCRGDDYRESEV